MKFLHNSKCHQRMNRKGGMLVLVLIIFAVSLILISSAMTITLASRSRYYVDTERSQERLTLSCAAETILDAIEKQELPDAELEKMVNNGKYSITGASEESAAAGASAYDGKDIAPGLANASNSETYFTVSKADEATDDLYLTFSTYINVTDDDKKAENLRVRLKYNPPTPVTEICANMVTCGDPTSPDVVDVQMLYVNTDKSYTVLHGNVNITSAGETYIHNPTVLTGVAKGGNGTKYYNDMIFYGPDAGMDVKSEGNGFQIESGHGEFYFLGTTVNGNKSTQSVTRNANGSPAVANGFNIRADGLYLYNASFTSQDYTAGGGDTKYWVVGKNATANRPSTNDGQSNVIIKNGGTANVASVSTVVYNSIDEVTDANAKNMATKMETKASKYLTDKALLNAVSHHVPTSEEQSAAYGQYCKGTSLTPTQLNNKDTVVDGNQAYKMSGTYTYGSLEIDLSKGSASIYMSADVVLNAFTIKVSNSYDAQLIIVLAKGADLSLTAPNWGAQGCRISAILSCDNRKSTNFQNPYPPNTNLTAVEGQKPAALIVGLGSNEFSMGQAQVCDAYLSLAGIGDEASTVNFQNGPFFYGRFEAVNYHYSNGDPIKLSYCPSMNEEDDTPKPLKSCYTVEGYEYTYDV